MDGFEFIFTLFGTAAWSLRDVIPVHYLALLIGLVIAFVL